MSAARLVLFQARMRPGTVVVIAAVIGFMAVKAGDTVPNVYNDPSIPRTPVALLLGAALASGVALHVRPLLGEGERLAARDMVAARCWLVGSSVLVPLAAAWASMAVRQDVVVATQRIELAGALVGIALLAGHFGAFWGALVPALYVVSGLAFGYDTSVGGAARVRPWAWLIATDGARPLLEAGILLAGMGVAILFGSRADEPGSAG